MCVSLIPHTESQVKELKLGTAPPTIQELKDTGITVITHSRIARSPIPAQCFLVDEGNKGAVIQHSKCNGNICTLSEGDRDIQRWLTVEPDNSAIIVNEEGTLLTLSPLIH